MDIKLTDVAKYELMELDPAARKKAVSSIRGAFEGTLAHDPLLKLQELNDAAVSVHRLEDLNLVVLYRIEDVDSNKKDEAVILTLISKDELPDFSNGALAKLNKDKTANKSWDPFITESTPKSARIGHELLSKLFDEV